MTLQEAAHIATMVGTLGLIGLIVQIRLSAKQIAASHERGRREKTVELLMEWSKNLDRNTSLARKIIESLSQPDSINLFEQKPFQIPLKHKPSIVIILNIDKRKLKTNKDHIKLSQEQSSMLRWFGIRYLNLLESILVAWQNNIVDCDIIESEFSYLFEYDKGHEALKNFRVAAGGPKSYPAIEAFAKKIELIKKTPIATKKTL